MFIVAASHCGAQILPPGQVDYGQDFLLTFSCHRLDVTFPAGLRCTVSLAGRQRIEF